MSKAGKVLIIAGLLFWAALYIFRLAYGGWHPSLWVPLVLGLLLLLAGIAKDWRKILEFFTMRTTKHGMNMGAVIVLALVGLACLNILSARYEHKFDWTSDKLNSLTEQSVQVAQTLKQDTKLVLLYRGDDQNGENIQTAIKNLATMYSNVSPKITYESHNAIVDPATAKQYDYSAGPFALFVVQGDHKLKVDQTTEEGVTRALIKLGRTSKKVIYFVTGHGERDLDSKDPDGLSFLAEQLRVTYDVRALTLYANKNVVPADAAVVAVIRPTQQYLESEIHALHDYVAGHDGHLFMALDPGMKQNLSALAKSFGIEFHNDYILDLRSQVVQAGPATVLGSNFPDETDITKAFKEGTFAMFHVASSLQKAPDAPAEMHVTKIIGTSTETMATTELGKVNFKPNGPHTIAMESVFGKSSAIVFGDSDFLSNALIQNNLNNDLVLNSFSELANDKDLISIRPRSAKGTKLEMTRQNFNVYIFTFLLPLPLLLFAIGFFFWYRRRTA